METVKGYVRFVPEMNFVSSGSAISKFAIYDTEEKDYKSKVHCVAWEDVAEGCHNKIGEGDIVYAKGYFKDVQFTTKEGKLVKMKQFTCKQVFVDMLDGTFGDVTDSKFRPTW